MMRPLDELRTVERAMVMRAGTIVGRLVRRVDAVEYVAEPGATSGAAITLPAGQSVITHAPGALPPFFAGLLPEGRRLTALRQATKTSADDEFTLLLAVGGDTIGDVCVIAEGDSFAPPRPALEVAAWSDVSFASLFSDVSGGGVIDRVAIAGVQDKVSARVVTTPVGQSTDRYLSKLDPPEVPHLVANEAFFLGAARSIGLPTADHEVVVERDGRHGLLVRRFDRVTGADGNIMPLAQEDGCQVLGRWPADKYRLSTEEVISGLARNCRAGPVAALAFLEQFVFAYLSCNGDAHAKNVSIRFVAGEWMASPLYDAPSSHPYGDTSMALSINGRTRENIGRDDFVALGEAVGVRPRATRRAIAAIVDRSGGWIERLDELPFDERRVHRLRRAIEYRRARLAG